MGDKKVQKKKIQEPKRRGSCIWVILIAVIAIVVIIIVGLNKGGKKYSLKFNTEASISCIDASKNDVNATVEIKANAFIKEIVRQIEKVKENDTKIASISDKPVVDEFYTLKFDSVEGEEVIYLYEKDEKCYIEEPYNGIFEITKESYSIIMDYVDTF